MITEDQERRIRHIIDRAFAADADKYEADKHAALEKIDDILHERNRL